MTTHVPPNQTQDGGYIVAGATTSFGAGNYDFWIIKLDGMEMSRGKRYTGGQDTIIAHSIRQPSDGGYLVAGSTQSSGAGNDDLWLLKLNNTGNVTWEKTYGGHGL